MTTDPNITRDLTTHWSRAFAAMTQHADGTTYGPHEVEDLCACLHELYSDHKALESRVETLAADRDQWVTAASAHRAEIDRLASRVAELENGCQNYAAVLRCVTAERDAARALLREQATCQCSLDEACRFVRERDAALARVAELEAAAAPVEWREGVPSVEDIVAHAQRSVQQPSANDGLWVWDPEPQWPVMVPRFLRIGVRDNEVTFSMWDPDLNEWVLFDTPFSGHDVFTPADTDTKLPIPWPVHASGTAPDSGDCEGSDAD